MTPVESATVHSFNTSEEAYDAGQCDPHVQNGDILLIRDEKIVGLAWTWPVAVTVEHGALHTPTRVVDRAGGEHLERLRGSAQWSVQNILDAVSVACGEGWEVNPFFTHFDVGGEK